MKMLLFNRAIHAENSEKESRPGDDSLVVKTIYGWVRSHATSASLSA